MDSAQRLYKPPANEDVITEAVRQGARRSSIAFAQEMGVHEMYEIPLPTVAQLF